MNRAELRRIAIVIAPGLALVMAVATLVAFLDSGGVGGPRIGDHWHAPYTIVIFDVRQPAIPEIVTPRGVHTHGDSVIHVHPHIAEAEGSGASLANFFADMGGTLTNTEIAIPSQFDTYRDGTITGDETDGVIVEGVVLRLRILRADSGIHPLGAGFAAASAVCNTKPDSEFERVDAAYEPQDGDCIRIVFGPAQEE